MRKTCCALSLAIVLSSAPMVIWAAPAHKAQPHTKPAAVSTKKAPATKAAKTEDKAKGIIDNSYRDVQSINLLQGADKWVGEKVSFEAVFNSFSAYALDYKGAMRSSKDYISFLIQRPDVTHHNIPLSELKLVYPRKNTEKVLDLENGDKVLVKGKVFSAALGDPWLDVDELILLKKSPENEAKAKEKDKKKHELE